MRVKCKSCGAAIPAADVNIDRMVAKCAQCDAVFGISSFIRDGQGETRVRAEVPLPKGMEILRGDEPPEARPVGYREGAATRPTLSLVRRWFKPLQHIFTFLFSLIWCSFLVFWYTMAAAGQAPLLFFLFPLIHVAVGIFLFYTSLAGFLNKTYIEVDGERIRVRHAPLPWIGGKELPSQNVRQLYCTSRTRRTKNGGSSTTYNVQVALHSGRPVDLLTKLGDLDQALFIEQEIERALGIEDEPMPGEVK